MLDTGDWLLLAGMIVMTALAAAWIYYVYWRGPHA